MWMAMVFVIIAWESHLHNMASVKEMVSEEDRLNNSKWGLLCGAKKR